MSWATSRWALPRWRWSGNTSLRGRPLPSRDICLPDMDGYGKVLTA
ncbi:MAG: hypothetical protein U0793_25385 [Gemmataceae bacterium]